MPHISRFLLNGEPIPSVNEVTDSLSKDGLIRFFYRRHGFVRADAIGRKARKAGTDLAKAFDLWRTKGEEPVDELHKRALSEWVVWMQANGYEFVKSYPEVHLVNTKDGYHGSPDYVGVNSEKVAFIGDDKLKKRFPDYRLLMNEHAYAMCEKMDLHGKLVDVPWKVPVETLVFWVFCPACGKLFPQAHKWEASVYEDFLICKNMRDVNKAAEAYYHENGSTLPEHEGCGDEDED